MIKNNPSHACSHMFTFTNNLIIITMIALDNLTFFIYFIFFNFCFKKNTTVFNSFYRFV